MNRFPGRVFTIIFTGILFLWTIGLFVPLIASAFHLSPVLPLIIQLLFQSVCHQLPERTISINSCYFPVCARCLGIYLGFAITLLYGILKRFQMLSIFVIFALCIPMFIDIGRLILNISQYNKAIASITGGLFGIASGNLYLEFYYTQYTERNEK